MEAREHISPSVCVCMSVCKCFHMLMCVCVCDWVIECVCTIHCSGLSDSLWIGIDFLSSALFGSLLPSLPSSFLPLLSLLALNQHQQSRSSLPFYPHFISALSVTDRSHFAEPQLAHCCEIWWHSVCMWVNVSWLRETQYRKALYNLIQICEMTFHDMQLMRLDICSACDHQAPILTNHISSF